MKLVLEILTGVLLDAAMLVLVLHLLKAPEEEKRGCRPAALTFAVGFALGTTAQCLAGESPAAVILCALGFMLAYTAFLFTFPEKRKRHESR